MRNRMSSFVSDAHFTLPFSQQLDECMVTNEITVLTRSEQVHAQVQTYQLMLGRSLAHRRKSGTLIMTKIKLYASCLEALTGGYSVAKSFGGGACSVLLDVHYLPVIDTTLSINAVAAVFTSFG